MADDTDAPGFTSSTTDGDGALFGDPSKIGTDPGVYDSWSWKEIKAAVAGASMVSSKFQVEDTARAAQVSNPQTLFDASALFAQTQQELTAIGAEMRQYADDLAGDGGTWAGAAASTFHATVTQFADQVIAQADALSGGYAGQPLAVMLYQNGAGLQKAIYDVNYIDDEVSGAISDMHNWDSAHHIKDGYVHNGLIMVHLFPTLVKLLHDQMLTVLRALAADYRMTIDNLADPPALAAPTPGSAPGSAQIPNFLGGLPSLPGVDQSGTSSPPSSPSSPGVPSASSVPAVSSVPDMPGQPDVSALRGVDGASASMPTVSPLPDLSTGGPSSSTPVGQPGTTASPAVPSPPSIPVLPDLSTAGQTPGAADPGTGGPVPGSPSSADLAGTSPRVPSIPSLSGLPGLDGTRSPGRTEAGTGTGSTVGQPAVPSMPSMPDPGTLAGGPTTGFPTGRSVPGQAASPPSIPVIAGPSQLGPPAPSLTMPSLRGRQTAEDSGADPALPKTFAADRSGMVGRPDGFDPAVLPKTPQTPQTPQAPQIPQVSFTGGTDNGAAVDVPNAAQTGAPSSAGMPFMPGTGGAPARPGGDRSDASGLLNGVSTPWSGNAPTQSEGSVDGTAPGGAELTWPDGHTPATQQEAAKLPSMPDLSMPSPSMPSPSMPSPSTPNLTTPNLTTPPTAASGAGPALPTPSATDPSVTEARHIANLPTPPMPGDVLRRDPHATPVRLPGLDTAADRSGMVGRPDGFDPAVLPQTPQTPQAPQIPQVSFTGGTDNGAAVDVPNAAQTGAPSSAGMPFMPGTGGAPARPGGDRSDASGLLNGVSTPWSGNAPTQSEGSVDGTAPGGAELTWPDGHTPATQQEAMALTSAAVATAAVAAAAAARRAAAAGNGESESGADVYTANGGESAFGEEQAAGSSRIEAPSGYDGAAHSLPAPVSATESGRESAKAPPDQRARQSSADEEPSAWNDMAEASATAVFDLGLWASGRRRARVPEDVLPELVSSEAEAWSDDPAPFTDPGAGTRIPERSEHADPETAIAATWRPDRSARSAAEEPAAERLSADELKSTIRAALAQDEASRTAGGDGETTDADEDEPQRHSTAELLTQDTDMWGVPPRDVEAV